MDGSVSSVWAGNSANCALVGGDSGEPTLGVRRQASGGRKRAKSFSESSLNAKCFTFNKQRQRRGQGLQQGLGTIPENSVYMTDYDRKGISICREQAKEEKK